MIDTFLSAVQQVIVFSLIPFIVYLIRHKKFKGFFSYIGLKPYRGIANVYAVLLMVVLASPMLIFTLISEDFRDAFFDPKTVTGTIREIGFGIEAIVIILSVAIIKTSLSEEIFFRGFVAKRLIAITNYQIGNWIQAILFGLIHILLFLSITEDPLFLALSFIIPTFGAYAKTHLNEKIADGSIIPGWIAHASANLLSYSIIAFVI